MEGCYTPERHPEEHEQVKDQHKFCEAAQYLRAVFQVGTIIPHAVRCSDYSAATFTDAPHLESESSVDI